jgi:hypothetical protein
MSIDLSQLDSLLVGDNTFQTSAEFEEAWNNFLKIRKDFLSIQRKVQDAQAVLEDKFKNEFHYRLRSIGGSSVAKKTVLVDENMIENAWNSYKANPISEKDSTLSEITSALFGKSNRNLTKVISAMAKKYRKSNELSFKQQTTNNGAISPRKCLYKLK